MRVPVVDIQFLARRAVVNSRAGAIRINQESLTGRVAILVIEQDHTPSGLRIDAGGRIDIKLCH